VTATLAPTAAPRRALPPLAPIVTPQPAIDDPAEQRALDAQLAAMLKASERDFDSPTGREVNVAGLVAEACGEDPRTGRPYYTRDDVLGWYARAVELGAGMPRLSRSTIRKLFRLEVVPNARLRETYEARVAGGATGLLLRLARALGMETDTTGVERLLGIKTVQGRRGGPPTLRLFVNYEQAVALSAPLGLDYHDLGV
jgi:hypothetical protein